MESNSKPNSTIGQNTLIKQPTYEDEIDLRELFSTIWKGKFLILFITIIFMLTGIIFALNKPNIYKSEILVTPYQTQEELSSRSLNSEFEMLATLAGIKMQGSNKTDTKIPIAMLESRMFINSFILRNNLYVRIVASTGWDPKSGNLNINKEIYDEESKKWSMEQREFVAYNKFIQSLKITNPKNSDLVSISFQHYSPLVAQQILELLIIDFNQWSAEKAKNKTERNIEYLQHALLQTNSDYKKKLLEDLLKAELKKQIFEGLNKNVTFEILDPASIDFNKVSPKRRLILIISTLLGFMLSIFIVLIKHFIITSRIEKTT